MYSQQELYLQKEMVLVDSQHELTLPVDSQQELYPQKELALVDFKGGPILIPVVSDRYR